MHKGPCQKVLFLLLLLARGSFCQAGFNTGLGEDKPPLYFGWEDAAVLGFQSGASCILAGIGAARHGNNVLQACGIGAFGGSLMYTGQKIAVYSPYYWGLAYGAQATGSLGASIRDNLIAGNPPLSRYQYDVGGLARVSIGRPETHANGRKFNIYALPAQAAFSVFGLAMAEHPYFDPALTLRMGVPVFHGGLGSLDPESVNGSSYPVIILGSDEISKNFGTMGHEMVHVLQGRYTGSVDAFFEGTQAGHFFDGIALKPMGGLGAGVIIGTSKILGLPHDARPEEIIPELLETPLNMVE
ncbi:MAG: hypothetical protein HY547_00960 [Elusimicrobia bacterium]|nr:hypothetical protein [Elusimicrobiota bacterium]